MHQKIFGGLVVLTLCAALGVACAPKHFRTGARIDHTYDFSTIDTYAFVVVREKVRNSATGKILQQAIREHLSVRGYLEVPAEDAEVHLNYDIGVYAAARLYRERQHDSEGGLSIWVKDVKTGQTVWYGWAERILNPDEDADTAIRAAVRDLFEQQIPDAGK